MTTLNKIWYVRYMKKSGGHWLRYTKWFASEYEANQETDSLRDGKNYIFVETGEHELPLVLPLHA